jgi:hypothetical protein
MGKNNKIQLTIYCGVSFWKFLGEYGVFTLFGKQLFGDLFGEGWECCTVLKIVARMTGRVGRVTHFMWCPSQNSH